MKNVTKTNALFAFMIIFYLIMLFVVAALPGGLSNDVSMILPELLMMVPAIIYIVAMKAETADDIKFKLPSFKQLLLLILITYLMMPITTVLNVITSLGVESAGESITGSVMSFPYWKSMLYIAVIPAVCEEFLFRGLIYHGYRVRNRFVAIFLSGFLFGIMHLNINQFSYAFVMGVVFALTVEITGSLLSTIIMHFLFNGTSVTISYLIKFFGKYVDYQNAVESGQQTEAAAAGTASAVASTVFVIVFYAGITVISVCLLILALRKLAKVSGKLDDVKSIFSKQERTLYKDEGKFVDVFLIIGLVPAMGFIILEEILTRMV